MFIYDIFFESWDDIYNLERELEYKNICFEFDAYHDRLFIYGDWEDASIAEHLMSVYGIEFWEER